MKKFVSALCIVAGLLLFPVKGYAFSVISEFLTKLQGSFSEVEKIQQKAGTALDEEILEKEGQVGPKESFTNEVNIPTSKEIPTVSSEEISKAVETGKTEDIQKVAEETLRPQTENTQKVLENQKKQKELLAAVSTNAYSISMASLSSLEKSEEESKKRTKQVKKSKDTRQVQTYINELSAQITERWILINYLDLMWTDLKGVRAMGALSPKKEDSVTKEIEL